MHLFDLLFPPRDDERIIREISDDEFFALMCPKLIPITQPVSVSLLPYAHPFVRSAVHEAKYHGSKRAFALLSRVLADYLLDADDIGRNPILIPLPLGKTRRKERGFNQTEEVVRLAANELALPIDTSLLVRTRETESQVSLAREKREANVRGAFATSRTLDPRPTYILIDDVITTGATLQAATDALSEAGAVHVLPLALAH